MKSGKSPSSAGSHHPLRQTRDDDDPGRGKPKSQTDAPSHPRRQVRLLLADDHPIIRDGLRRLLDSHVDFKVVGAAADGAEVIELAPRLLPDVILLDFNMPRISGVQAARELRQIVPDIPLIGLSMHEQKQVDQTILDAGFAGYVRKDCAIERLHEAIFAALQPSGR